MEWIRDKPLFEEKISASDLELVTITSDIDEACAAMTSHREQQERRRRSVARPRGRRCRDAQAGGGR